MQYRRNDKFGGFVYLHIPWNWKWKKKAISKSFEQLVSRLMNNLDIKLHISELPDSDAGVVPDTFAMRFSRV